MRGEYFKRLGFSNRLAVRLEAMSEVAWGTTEPTGEQLSTLTEVDLLLIPGIGRKTLEEFRSRFSCIGKACVMLYGNHWKVAKLLRERGYNNTI